MSLFMRLIVFLTILGVSFAFASIGKVSLLKGEAFVERAGEKLNLKNGMEIEEKDTLYTSKDAQIQLIFEDKTVITLGSQSEFKVEEYLSEGSKPKAKFKFNQGVFKTITGQIGKKAPENFTLETKTATIGIRGTVIGGVVPPPNSSAPDTIFCLGGKITATSRQTGVTVALPTGTMTVVPPSGPPAPPRQVTPQDIQQFNQNLGTPPPPAHSEGSSSQSTQSGKSSQNSETTQNQESGASQTQQSNTAAAQQSSSDTTTASSSGNNVSTAPVALSMNETPPPPPSVPVAVQTQIAVPTAATAALQTNLQTLSQEVVVKDVAKEIGVTVEEIKEQIASGNPVVPPTVPVTPPITDPVTPPPTDPVVPPTVPVTPPVTDPITPPPTDPVVPPTVPVTPPATDPVTPPPTNPTTPPNSGGSGEVVQTCPSGTSGTYPNCVELVCPSGTVGTYPNCVSTQTQLYTALFLNMSASDGASQIVSFPDDVNKTMVFDATNKIWKSSDNSYIVTSTDGNFSYVNALSGTQTMYVKDLTQPSCNPILFKSFPTDTNASGYLPFVSGLVPIPSTWYELVSGVKSVMNSEYGYAVKYEQNSFTRLWAYNFDLKLFYEAYYIGSELYDINNFAALYSDISNPDTAYQAALVSYINNEVTAYNEARLYTYLNFYIHGVPDANQNLKNYGILDDGGKWYFTYDKNDSNYASTINVYGNLPITDAVVTSKDYVPFMQTTKGYPIYVVDRSGYKEMYSIKNFDSISNYMFNWVNNHFLEINTDYVTADGSNIVYYHAPEGVQQNVYLFYKIDENGNLIEDPRNGKMVNPITGNALNLYTNYHSLGESSFWETYVFGPINNPLLDNDTLPTPQSGNSISYYNYGITPLSLNMGVPDNIGNDFRKLAIEKARWIDKPNEEEIYLYSDYSANRQYRDFTHIGNTQTYIKFPQSGNGIMMDTHFDVVQEKDGSDQVVKNYVVGSITTGRVVENETDGSNKIVFKHFDTMSGVLTSDSTSSYGTTHNMYLFNEKDQFVNANNGGLDNNKNDNDGIKYNWLVHEEVNATTSQVASVDLMKKVAENNNEDLFRSVDYDRTFATGAMSGFMIGEDISANVWMGDMSAFDANASGGRGVLTVIAPSNELNITTPVSMAGLSQTDAGEAIPSASFVGEDMQAMIIESRTINGKTYDFAMATLPDTIVDGKYSYQNDYSSWGYWVATEKNAPIESRSYAQGYWVAGYETPDSIISSIPANSIYTYSGNVLGTVTNGTVASPIILDSDNSFKASVKFGAANPVTITEIKFNTVNNSLLSISGNSSNSSNTSTLAGNKFSGTMTEGANAVLNFNGKFYGPNAESIGGVWSGDFKNKALKGTGVFKASKTGVTAP